VNLSAWERRQAEQLALLDIKQDGETPVCINDLGTFIDPTLFSRWRREFFV
jgi:hypothetical protein